MLNIDSPTVKILSKTDRPNLLCYLAMHQDYSEDYVAKEIEKFSNLSEQELGDRIVRNCVKMSHWGILEHPTISFNVINFPHSVIVQARTHRIGVSFDCLASESMITIKQGNKKISIEELYEKQQRGGKLPLVKSLNEDQGYFEYNPIKEVFKNKVKDLYLVTLEDGKELKCSLDHRILSDKGWIRLEDLKIGDKISCNEESVYPHFVRIVNIKFLRNDITYDIEVSGNFHNFVCNGIVVHNCQSQRYTSERIIKLAYELKKHNNLETIKKLIEQVFYFRTVGHYDDREGNKYFYSEENRNFDILFTQSAIEYYAHKVDKKGYAPEHARDILTQNIRQHFVVSFNARSLLHFCDLRTPKDAQPEIRLMASMLFEKFKIWMPEVAEFYEKKRLGKNKLAP